MTIRYDISFPAPETHYVHVRMTLSDVGSDSLEVSLPVWTPGSYLVREYSQHLESISARNTSGTPLEIEKTDKNTWRLKLGRSKTAVIDYSIYCYDASVRTNFVDIDHATLIGANTFLYVDGATDLPAILEFKPYAGWKDIATPLAKQGKNPWVRLADNYDMIVDSPVEIGNLKEYEFKAGGVPHTLAVFGDNNADMDALVSDLQKICEEEIRLFGDSPCKSYLFILLNTENRYNGLEHLNSSLNQLPRWEFHPREKYQRSIGLLSHEYFHLWNVKRIRPVELSSFDYDREVYTRQLWVAEGLTSYYDDYVLYRTGIFTRPEYLNIVARMLNGVVNNPGDTVQSLTEASHDAWIKYYRKNENSNNNLVTYYDKGAMIVHALNFLIMHETKAKKSFDDVLRKLWAAYKARPEVGYTEEEFREILESVAGVELDDFFQRHIYGREPVDYARYFGYAGLELVDNNKGKDLVYLGMTSKWDNGKLLISKLERGYGAYEAGLNVNDEILAIDGHRTDANFERIYEQAQIGERMTFLISRQGLVREIEVELTANQEVKYSIVPRKNPGKLQEKILTSWLGAYQ